MLLRDIDDVRSRLGVLNGTLVGVGMTAYSRITPGSFIDPYPIAALHRTADLPLLRKKTTVFCLEEALGGPWVAQGANSADLLSHPLTRAFLNTLPDPKHLLIYQGYPQLESMAESEGWSLLANPASLRLALSDRAVFRDMIDRLALKGLPGGVYPLETLFTRTFRDWSHDLGDRLVFQLPDITQGGGRGTFFVQDEGDYLKLRDGLQAATWRGIRLTRISVHPFVKGIPVSLAVCLTRHGLLLSGLQRQLVDLPYCDAFAEKGVFCGHAWGVSGWPADLEEEAASQARLMGQHLATLGYKGILGIDFLIHENGRAIVPLECNYRYTGAFPMLSRLHIQNRIIPLDAFHILELMDLPYELDIREQNEQYRRALRGSHLILFTRSGRPISRACRLKAGVYEIHAGSGQIRFLRESGEFQHIHGEDQFVVIDGPPVTGDGAVVFEDPFHRLCRLLFPGPVIDEAGDLVPGVRQAVEWVYQQAYG